MKVVDLFEKKQKEFWKEKPITIVCIGDSVTQGCFEARLTSKTTVEPVFDYKSAYPSRLREVLSLLYPSVQINVVNSGISSDTTEGGLFRFKRDVLAYNPDLVIISYGLNDSSKGLENLEEYKRNLSKMFTEVNNIGAECIFLTQNMMATAAEPQLIEEMFIDLNRKTTFDIQHSGVLKNYFDNAKEVCDKYKIKVCDMYSLWEKMYQNGVDINLLLANKFNHPIREMHYYIAIKLVETILLH